MAKEWVSRKPAHGGTLSVAENQQSGREKGLGVWEEQEGGEDLHAFCVQSEGLLIAERR